MPETTTELPILPQSELRLVLALNRLYAATAPQLSRHLKGDPSPNTAQRLLYRLEEKGIVRGNKLDTARVWELVDPSKLPAMLEEEARHLLTSRYDRDPLALKALLDQISRLLNDGLI